MKTLFCTFLVSFGALFAQAQTTYTADILGNGYECTTLQLKPDYEGEAVATLIRKKSEQTTNKAVLYIHGYCDYFFQKELGQQFNAQGYHFYALDLRKYGRSIRPHQKKFNVRDVSEYYEEIDRALDIIKAEGNTNITLCGHSTGGLVTTLYAHDRKGKNLVNALILNSPFYDFNISGLLKLFAPSIAKKGQKQPDKMRKNKISTLYGESLHKNYKGEWDYSLDWKPLSAPDITLGWLNAIYQGQKRVQKGLDLGIPVLLLRSRRSIYEKKWSDELFKGDAVLNVEHMRKYGKGLLPEPHFVVIEDGLHDLILSKKIPREKTYEEIFDWLKKLK